MGEATYLTDISFFCSSSTPQSRANDTVRMLVYTSNFLLGSMNDSWSIITTIYYQGGQYDIKKYKHSQIQTAASSLVATGGGGHEGKKGCRA